MKKETFILTCNFLEEICISYIFLFHKQLCLEEQFKIDKQRNTCIVIYFASNWQELSRKGLKIEIIFL